MAEEIKESILRQMVVKIPSDFLIRKKDYDGVPGVYCITNLVNNKRYIGSTVNLYTRFCQHSRALINNKHENIYLQRSFNIHGLHNFKFSILEEYKNLKGSKIGDTREFLEYCEQFQLNSKLNASDYILEKNKIFTDIGYNMRPYAWDATKSKLSNKGSENRGKLLKGSINAKYFYQFSINGDLISENFCVSTFCLNSTFTLGKLLQACKENKYYKGYFWSYCKEQCNFNKPKRFKLIKLQHLDTHESKYFDSMEKCSKFLKVSNETIPRYLKSGKAINNYKISHIAK